MQNCILDDEILLEWLLNILLGESI